MPLLDHFGLLAPVYEFFIKPKPPEELDLLLEMPQNGTLLDAGGGTGRVSQYFLQQASLVAVADLSCKMLQEANKKEGLNPVCSHTELLPFPAGYFDRVIMVDALHHVCDQKETARELWRVLKPGGLIIIEEPDIRNLSVKLVALGEKVAFMRSHFLAPAEIVALFDGDPGEIDVNLDRYIARVVIKKSG